MPSPPAAGALVGTVVGIASSDVANAARGEFDVTGIFDVPKATGTAWTEGATIYWDNTAKNFTTVSTSNTKAGVALANDPPAPWRRPPTPSAACA
jgi:predicted RecA/RadA family phage recombinase